MCRIAIVTETTEFALKVPGLIPERLMVEVTPAAMLSGIKTWVLLVVDAITFTVEAALVVVFNCMLCP